MVDLAYLKELVQNPEKMAQLDFSIIKNILKKAFEIFSEGNLILDLELKNKYDIAYIIGDIHGNLKSLLYFFNKLRKEKPKFVLFLGDIVDRGDYQLECLILILAMKIIMPKSIYLLRGNHETLEMNRSYGFYYEFIERFQNKIEIDEINSLYQLLPACALINNRLFCVHGGISKNYSILRELKNKKVEDREFLSNSHREDLFQMMWNDPKSQIKGFSPSYRGSGIYFFGGDAFNEFMEYNDLRYMIRSHECFPEGYRWFFNKRLLSIFSSSNYRRFNPASYAILKSDKLVPVNIDI